VNDAEKLAAIRLLADSWYKGYDVAYDDAAYQILHILNDERTDFYGHPWSPLLNLKRENETR
jgi:hypothetical protein